MYVYVYNVFVCIHREYNRTNRFAALKILAWEYLYTHIALVQAQGLRKNRMHLQDIRWLKNLSIENKYYRNNLKYKNRYNDAF